MRKGIHPELKECKVKCACGNEFTVKSTQTEIQLETCPKCNSFYTGKFATSKKGNVQKFKDKWNLNDEKETVEK
ncbi:MAG: 50S ribosomal protein L31 [Bacilli bacterium]